MMTVFYVHVHCKACVDSRGCFDMFAMRLPRIPDLGRVHGSKPAVEQSSDSKMQLYAVILYWRRFDNDPK